MSGRFTHKDVEAAFADFCGTVGIKAAESYKDKGAYQLDHNGVYGGYVIEKLSDHGGVSRPFGDMRHGAREMCDMLNFASWTVRLTRGNKE